MAFDSNLYDEVLWDILSNQDVGRVRPFQLLDSTFRTVGALGANRLKGDPVKAFTQDPNETIIYRQPIVGDSISTAAWSIDPSAGVTLAGQADTPTETKIAVSGLTAGTTYALQVRMTMASGQIRERTGTVICRGT